MKLRELQAVVPGNALILYASVWYKGKKIADAGPLPISDDLKNVDVKQITPRNTDTLVCYIDLQAN